MAHINFLGNDWDRCIIFFCQNKYSLFNLISSTCEIEVGNGLRGLFPGGIKSFSSYLSSLL